MYNVMLHNSQFQVHGPLGWRAAVPLYHVGVKVSVQMCVCATVLTQIIEVCIVKVNNGGISVASLAHVRKHMHDTVFILCILPNSLSMLHTESRASPLVQS